MTKYVINLAEDVERLAFQREQFSKLALDFERFEACRDDERHVDRFRWWCVMLRPRVRGEIGCTWSHGEIHRMMSVRRESCAAIFEDDIVVSESLPKALEIAEGKCREDPKAVILLGDHRRFNRGEPVTGADADLRIEPAVWDFAAEGYVLGCEAARALARAQRHIRTPADAWSYFRRKGFVNLYRMTPPVCKQHPDRFGTTIGERYVVAGRPLPERLWWKARRIVGVLIDGILDGGRFGW